MTESVEQKLQPRCAKCGDVASTVILKPEGAGYRFVYDGPGGGTGSHGDLISKAEGDQIIRAFSAPYSVSAMESVDLHDNGGMCLECGKFYCTKHWAFDSTCPAGHIRSNLDPHWYPPEIDYEYLRDRWPGGPGFWGGDKEDDE
jgi:hypothetical protein